MTATGLQRAMVMEHAAEIADRRPGLSAALRAVLDLVATQAAVINRYREGWSHTWGTEGEGDWIMRVYSRREPMTPAERTVVYGEKP